MRKLWHVARRLFWLALKTFFIVLMLVIPIPILIKPEITNAYRRNQITRVEKQKPPG